MALVFGSWPYAKDLAQIDLPLLRLKETKQRLAVIVDEMGKSAMTSVERVSSHGLMQLLRLSPKTGRMHQLRVHCAATGMPIVGDDIYGDFKKNKSVDRQFRRRLFLHAKAIEFYHPVAKKRILVESELPEVFSDITRDK